VPAYENQHGSARRRSRRQRKIHDKDVCPIKAGLNAPNLKEAFDHQRRSDQQNECKRYLRGDQGTAEEATTAA
jgi:hypothetical protein